MTKRYHVHAWGSPDHPDIDGEFDEVPPDLNWKYPFVSTTLQHAISRKELLLNLSQAPQSDWLE